MKIELFTVKDVKAGRFTGVVMFPNRQVALRAFSTAVNDKSSQSLLSQYPEDAQIFCVGTFDDESGELIQTSEFVCNALDLVKKETSEHV